VAGEDAMRRSRFVPPFLAPLLLEFLDFLDAGDADRQLDEMQCHGVVLDDAARPRQDARLWISPVSFMHRTTPGVASGRQWRFIDPQPFSGVLLPQFLRKRITKWATAG
jgi:hypothetical protein